MYQQLITNYLENKISILNLQEKFMELFLNRNNRDDLPEISTQLHQILEPFFEDIEAYHPTNTEEEELKEPHMYSTEKTVRKKAIETLEKLKELKA